MKKMYAAFLEISSAVPRIDHVRACAQYESYQCMYLCISKFMNSKTFHPISYRNKAFHKRPV